VTAAEKLRRAAEVVRGRVADEQRQQSLPLMLLAGQRLWDCGFHSPTVALAVADWLDSAASAYAEREPLIDAAIAVADAILAGVEG
jgi:hypothetical protein